MVFAGPWSLVTPQEFEEACPDLLLSIADRMPIRVCQAKFQLGELFEVMGSEVDEDLFAGVLIASAANYHFDDPATCFWLSLLGEKDGKPCPLGPISTQEESLLLEKLPTLNTAKLEFLPFLGENHSLIGRFRGDILTYSPEDVDGKSYKSLLPEGDFEPRLRAYIDSACNLLQELPMNKVRLEEGLAPFGFAWPWGPGTKPTLKSGMFQRGHLMAAQTNSIRFAGSVKLLRDQVEYSPSLFEVFKAKKLDPTIPSVTYLEFANEKERCLQELEQVSRKYFSNDCQAKGVIFKEGKGGLSFSIGKKGKGASIAFDEMRQDSSLPEQSWKQMSSQLIEVP